MEKKLRVGILGATGMVGQRFISLLENHPWFEVTTVAASPRSAGKTYEEAVGGRWKMTTPMPEKVKNLVVMNVNDVDAVSKTVDFVFSAVDMTKEEIRAIEEAYAKTETPVVSNNSAHRWTPDVPMVIPEINPEHFEVIKFQKQRLGTTRGFIAVKPNCSIQSYTPALSAWREFEPYEVVATTYQAISGTITLFCCNMRCWCIHIGSSFSRTGSVRIMIFIQVQIKRIVRSNSIITGLSFLFHPSLPLSTGQEQLLFLYRQRFRPYPADIHVPEYLPFQA